MFVSLFPVEHGCVKYVHLIEIFMHIVLDRAGNNEGRKSNFVSGGRLGQIALPGAGSLTGRSLLGPAWRPSSPRVGAWRFMASAEQ